jgi:hypothetical protein
VGLAQVIHGVGWLPSSRTYAVTTEKCLRQRRCCDVTFGVAFVLALGAVLVLQGVWLWPVLGGELAFYARDVLPFRLPYHAEFARQLVQGEWPAWTSRFGGGMPLWHHPSAELADPTAVLFALMPLHQAQGAQLMAHMFLSCAGVALLCRSFRAPVALSIWAGLLYVCSGPVASCWTVKFIPATALPWMVLGARMCARPVWRFPGVFPLTFAFQLLHPDMPAVVGALVASIAVVCASARPGFRRIALIRTLGGAAVGGLLAAPFLLPAWGILVNSARASVEHRAAPVDSLLQWLDALAPGASGVAGAAGSNAGLSALRGDETGQLVHNLFVGVSALCVLGCVLTASRRYGRRWWTCMGLAAALLGVLSRGADIPLLGAFWHLTSSRFPDKFLLPLTLLLLLAACRFGALVVAARVLPPRPVLFGWGLLGVGMVLAGTLLGTRLLLPWSVQLGPLFVPAADHLSAALTQSGVVILVVLTALRLATQARTRHVAALLICLAGTTEAFTNLSSLMAMTSVAQLSPPIRNLPDVPVSGQRLYAGDARAVLMGIPPVSGADLGDDENARLMVGLAEPLAGTLSGATYVANADYSRLEPTLMHRLVTEAFPRLRVPELVRLLRQLGAERLMIRGESFEGVGAVVRPVGLYPLGVAGTWLDMQVMAPFPPVSMSAQWTVEPDFRRTVVALAHAKDETVIIKEGPAAAPDNADPNNKTVLVTQQMSEAAMSFRTQARTPVMLVVRQTFDPGWRVTVDGRSSPLLVANACQRAVYIPAGTHDVEMRYHVPHARAGTALGLVGGVGLAALCVRRRRNQRPGSLSGAAAARPRW